MNQEMIEFYNEFMQEINSEASALEDFKPSIFIQKMSGLLEEQAVISNFEECFFKRENFHIRVDGWDFDEERGVLNLIIADWHENINNKPETLTKTEIDALSKRAYKFYDKSCKSDFYKSIDESDPGYSLAKYIFEKKGVIGTINIIIVSNRILSDRYETGKNKRKSEKNNFRITIWDFSRFFRLNTSGKENEDMIINFFDEFDQGIDFLDASGENENCKSYLLSLKGEFLADLYEEYGERLLEQNVRTFLQFKSKVNKGIRTTIENKPEMFFAFNNGLTTTAEKIVFNNNNDKIIELKNLQIVNGGQTTAAIFAARKLLKLDISKVYVQVKLSIIKEDLVNTLVPVISECANTQNKVNAADFFSNHPFHLRIESYSRSIWAPSKTGSNIETHWYYERARGQYKNAQLKMTKSEKKKFENLNPKNQMFTKTDLAKIENTFNLKPHVVSKGSQKNFGDFAILISKDYDKSPNFFNELYFKKIIAKIIMFRYLDKKIMKFSWYGGFKANIITYTLAKFQDMLNRQNKNLNFLKIWQRQQLSLPLEKQLEDIAEIVNEKILETPNNISNITEYCKKEVCWQNIRSFYIGLNNDFESDDFLVDDEKKYEEKVAMKEQKMMNDIEAQIYVISKGVDYWKNLIRWNLRKRLLTQKEISLITSATNVNIPPSEKQSVFIIKIEKKAIEEGFQG